MTTSEMCRRADLLGSIKRGEDEKVTERLLTESWRPEDLDHQADNDGTALFWAALRGYHLIVELLLTYGANVNERSQASGGTPLHGAADNGRTEVTRLLLQWGADISAKNHFKDTACHLAAYRGNAQVVSSLLRAGTDCSLKNSRGNSVLYEAKCGQYMLAGGQHSLVQHLIVSHQSALSQDSSSSKRTPSDTNHKHTVHERTRDVLLAGTCTSRPEHQIDGGSSLNRHCRTCHCSQYVEQHRT